MMRLLSLLLAFAALPAALAAAGVLPPVVGPTGALMAAALGLSGLAGRVVFHRLSAALLIGAVSGGVAALCNAHLGWPGSVEPLHGSAALVAAGIGCGFLAHALAFALAGTRGFGQDYRPARSAALTTAAAGPRAGPAHFVQARHPARLKSVYCRFHVAVTWTFALGWLALLALLIWVTQRHLWVNLTELPAITAMPPAGLMLAGGALLLLALTVIAVTTWWLVAGLLAGTAVAAGLLPPFDMRNYVRSGRFPLHWVAHEYAEEGEEAFLPDLND